LSVELISKQYKNSSRDEIANVNFYTVHPEATQIAEIMQNSGRYAVQGHRFWYQLKAHTISY